MTIDARHPLPGRRPLVVGAARSGLAAAGLLVRHGLDVVVCDRRPAAEATAAERTLAGLGVARAWGRDDASLLDGRDFLVWSPGIPFDHPLGVAARARALPVISELELGYLASHAPLIGITGTNGKSTTTDLVGALVRAAGREVSLRRFLMDRRVPAQDRGSLPLLAAGHRVFWVPGQRLDGAETPRRFVRVELLAASGRQA